MVWWNFKPQKHAATLGPESWNLKNTLRDLPTGLSVNPSTRPPIPMLGWIIWTAEGPLDALDTTRSQTVPPLRPGWPAAVNFSKTNTVNKKSTSERCSLFLFFPHLCSLGWADISEAFLSHRHRAYSLFWSVVPANSTHRLLHTYTHLEKHTAACGSSPDLLDTNNLKYKDKRRTQDNDMSRNK